MQEQLPLNRKIRNLKNNFPILSTSQFWTLDVPQYNTKQLRRPKVDSDGAFINKITTGTIVMNRSSLAKPSLLGTIFAVRGNT